VILVQYNVDNRSWAYLLTVTQIATKVEGYLPSGREIRLLRLSCCIMFSCQCAFTNL